MKIGRHRTLCRPCAEVTSAALHLQAHAAEFMSDNSSFRGIPVIFLGVDVCLPSLFTIPYMSCLIEPTSHKIHMDDKLMQKWNELVENRGRLLLDCRQQTSFLFTP